MASMDSSVLSVMKRFLNILFLVAIILSLINCEKTAEYDPNSPYAETEKKVRSVYDQKARFTWGEYNDLLMKLSENKFVVLPLNEMRNYFDTSKVVVGLRHDVEHNPFKALEMATIEKSYGMKATYFILATANYYGSFSNSKLIRNQGMGSLYKKIYNTGAEIGIHNDLLTVMISYKIDPFDFNNEELSFYKSLDIPIFGTASHGSVISKVTVNNYWIFSDFSKKDSIEYEGIKYPLGQHTLKEFGFEYEAYFIDYQTYFSESHGRWNDPEGLTGILKKLDSTKPGDRIQILTHPDHWGKQSILHDMFRKIRSMSFDRH